MSLYRKKVSVTIDAEQWRGNEHMRGVCCCTKSKLPHVHTMHGEQLVDLEYGDWVVVEPDGIHYYPIKPAVFAATYELAA